MGWRLSSWLVSLRLFQLLGSFIPVKKGDSRTLPALGYTTISFSNEQGGHRGELDKYCGMERAFYSIAIAIILSYIITIVLSVLRICKLHLYSKEEVERMLDDRESMVKLELKVHDPETPAQAPTTPVSNAPATAVPTNYSNNDDANRDLEAALAASAAPSIPRVMPSSSRSTLARPALTETTLAGPSYQSPHQPDISVSPVTPQFPLSPLSPVSPLTPLPPPPPPTTTRTTSTSTTLPIEAGFVLSSTEMHANLAMITDGSRYSPQQVDNSHSQLPPYSPGNHRRMNGHGDESNEIRLSEYVKGATRAQDMKDEGGY
ncbi:hypothetical protein VP1G_00936 [Cytospora mali]|uniref:Uncharacterized protein n=1 Tax=Cytospora mali TaxID=578113 RepID=A0A194UPF4_CYTMA|nr:hypothetical protein VP1G_00936 [Valsa mali var. pyri (nom. inval.)]